MKAHAQAVELPASMRPPKRVVIPMPVNNTTSILKILPDADCTVYIDGESKGNASAGNILRISLLKGTYLLKIVGANPADFISQNYSIIEAGHEILLPIKLQPLIAARLAKEEEEKRITVENEKQRKAVEEEAKRKAIEEINKIMPMVFVQGGSFKMGWLYDFHQVTVSSFYIGRYDVTQAEWKAIMGNNPSYHQNCDDCPVDGVSWNDVQEFIGKLNAKTGKNYRLPTEAEWEYAAKGGNKSNGYQFSGSNNIDEVAWHYDNSGNQTHPVGQKKPNELGLYDMTGNVNQWCQDWFNHDYYKTSPVENPPGPLTGTNRVLRGGGVFNPGDTWDVGYRHLDGPGDRDRFTGFRLVLVL